MREAFRVQLLPDVRLTCLQTRKFKSSVWSLRLRLPLQRQTALLNALLPRVLWRGTASLPDRAHLSAYLDQLYGGVIDPVVSKFGEVHSPGFVASFLDDALIPDAQSNLLPAAHLLGDLFLRPATRNGRLRRDYCAQEQGNLADDIRATLNEKRSYARLRLCEQMCAGEAYAVGRLGSLPKTELSISRLDRHYRELLSHAPIELFYCGSASPQRVSNAWRDALMELPRRGGAAAPTTRWEITPDAVRTFEEYLDVRQGKLVLGFRTGTTLSSPDFPALIVFNALLGASPASRLFRTVREGQSLCYYAQSSLERLKGLLLIECGVDSSDLSRAQESILNEVDALRRGDFTDQEHRAAARAAANALRAVQDHPMLLERHWAEQSAVDGQVSPQTMAALVEDVTREQLLLVGEKLRLDAVYHLCALEKGEKMS